MKSIPLAIRREGFQALFFGHPDATYVFDTSGTFIQCNQQLIQLTKYTRDELHEMTFEPIVHPDDREMVAAEFTAATTGETRRYQTRGIAKTGEIFIVDVTNIPVRDDHGDVVGVIGIARDISDIHQAEQARLRLEGTLHSTLDQMTLGIIFVNRGWGITFFNATGLRGLGLGTNDVLGKSFWEIFPDLWGTEFGLAYREAMKSGQASNVTAFYEPFNAWFQASVFPTSDGIVIQFWDVTADQKTRMELEKSSNRIRSQAALLDASHEAMSLRDLDGRITYWNKGAEHLFGWGQADAVGKLGSELLPVNADEFRLATKHVMEAGYWDGVLELITRDGPMVMVDCRWQLVTDEYGEPSAIFAIDSDITEWLRGEVQRNRAQRLESLGTLAGGIAHDLNNVLTPILMSAQLLSVGERDASRLALFNSIESGVRRGADMVQQVLSFARGEEGKVTVLNVPMLLAQVQDFCRDTLPKSIRFEVLAPSSLWAIRGDQTQLFQVLVNLVTNACDSMVNGGTLTIQAANVEDESSCSVVIEVEDDGEGMDAATASKIFEPFFTTKALGSGTGLGLPTSMTIIRNHGGDLQVFSEPGLGSRFQIRLPSTAEAHPEDTDPHAPATLLRGNNERILVVDDEVAIRNITCQALEASGYQTVAAQNGLEAVALMDQGARVDLVFTDMVMPEMDGAETAAYFLSRHPHVAVITASGFNTNDGEEPTGYAAAARFLPKPFTTTELLTSVRETLDTWGKE